MTGLIRVAIVDDQSLARMGVIALLQQEADIEVVAQGRTAADAIAIARLNRPDIILLDTTVAGDGVRAAGMIAAMADADGVRVIMLSESEDEATVCAAMSAGARGYLTKERHEAELVAVIRSVHAGENYVSPHLGGRLLLGRAARNGQLRKGETAAAMTRDEKIMRMVSRGYSNREIAEDMGLPESAVVHCVEGVLARIARDQGIAPRRSTVSYALAGPC